jgi:hypothetical protein
MRCLEEPAHEMPAHEMPAHEMPAHEVHAHEMSAHEVPAHEVPLYEMSAYKMHAHEVPVHKNALSGGSDRLSTAADLLVEVNVLGQVSCNHKQDVKSRLSIRLGMRP